MTEDEWRCLPCGTYNAADAAFCEMCGSPQPGPTRWTPPPEEPSTYDIRPVTVDYNPWPPPLAQHRDPEPARRRTRYLTGMLVGAVLVAAGGFAVVEVLTRSGQPDVPLAVDGVSPGSTAPGPSLPGSLPGPTGSGSPSPSPSRSTTAPSASPSRPASPSASPRPSPSAPAPTPSPTLSVGMVDVRAVNTDLRMPAVGGMYNSYFTAIDGRQYAQALSLYDPGGELDPNNPAEAAAFTQGVSTTTDSLIVLWSITDDPSHAGDIDTRITFRSTQQPGYGPGDAPSETCTLWNNTYRLHPGAGGYLISFLMTFSDQPC